MKICVVSLKSYGLFNTKVNTSFGGAEAQLYLIARQLARAPDVQVDFIVADYDQKPCEIYEGVRVWKTFRFRDNVFVRIVKLAWLIARLRSDVYIQRTLSVYSGPLALLCRVLGKKFVYMCANDGEVDGVHRFYATWWKRVMHRILFAVSSGIVVQNSHQQEKLQERFGRSGTLIYSVETLPPAPPAFGSKQGVLWVSRVDQYHKRAELFVELARALPQERFTMVAPPAVDQPEYFAKVQALALGTPNLTLVDFVPYDQIEMYFQQARVFVNTSHQEGFPHTFIQAWKFGTPVVSLIVNPDEVLQRHQIGFACDDSMETLSQRVSELLHDDALYEAYSRRAYEYTRAQHDIGQNVQRFYLFLKTL